MICSVPKDLVGCTMANTWPFWCVGARAHVCVCEGVRACVRPCDQGSPLTPGSGSSTSSTFGIPGCMVECSGADSEGC